MKLKLSSGISYQQLRHIYSKTGIWKKKITKTALNDIEKYWKERVTSPASYPASHGGNEDKKYILAMFPYPSGDLHMGHMRVYTISDALARYHRLTGSQVLHPIGWDAFGLPAENAAIDRGIAPRQWTESNIARMKSQLMDLRLSFDWEKEITTCNPDYYKWTQLIFLHMYQKGLAYSMKAAVNWDPVDQTVLADEQIDSHGNSWRSGAKAIKRHLTQWYLRSTNYTQSLLDGLDSLDPDSCRGFANAQRAWMKKPSGVRINMPLEPGRESLSVYTESPELLYGVRFLEISSDHPVIAGSEFKEGVVPGRTAIHPLTGEKLPLIVQKGNSLPDGGVGSCRFGIPSLAGVDEQTALQYNISIGLRVLDEEHKLINSQMFEGLTRDEAKVACCRYLQERKLGGWPTSRDLRDWLISRQRYWGTPIPIIHCPSCGTVPVPEEDLPVVLPEVDKIDLKVGNPLCAQQEWVNTPCPRCGVAAKRETDTMDTFVDSSWYFLRFTDPHNEKAPFSTEAATKYMPVDVYVGGAEHAILHMYYARFMNHFLCDEKMTSHREPFSLQLALGTVHSDCYRVTDTGKYLHRSKVSIDGETVVEKGTGQPVTHTLEKMSKSKYNGVQPSEVLNMHGVDQTRLYMLANAAPRAVKNWSPDLAKKLMFLHGKSISIPKWMHILWHTVSIIRQRREKAENLIDTETTESTIDMLYNTRNTSVQNVSLHMEHTFNLHEAIHSLYDNLSLIDKEAPLHTKVSSPHFQRCFADMLILLHPFAPHMTAELWEGLRTARQLPVDDLSHHDWEKDIFNQSWPTIDDEFQLPLIIRYANDAVDSQLAYDSPDGDQSEDDFLSDGQSEDESYNDTQLQEEIMRARRRYLHLTAKTHRTLTLDHAVGLAADAKLISSKGENFSETLAGSKLVTRRNCGSVLYLGEGLMLLDRSKQEVTLREDTISL
ncbi:leucine--tRNA ligase, mitochondrial-like [Watersipora subatra]|uniref:leucine--tRNA ligase, mitochondrial-like n=1 Tax=Watersipora subatra TaxID=2589382 RepID=UPI00355B7138